MCVHVPINLSIFAQVDTIVDYKYLLLGVSDRVEYESLIKCITEGMQLSILDHAITEFTKLCADIHHTMYLVVFSPISTQLDSLVSPALWSNFNKTFVNNSELPDYSFSPQEYITQVGIRNWNEMEHTCYNFKKSSTVQ